VTTDITFPVIFQTRDRARKPVYVLNFVDLKRGALGGNRRAYAQPRSNSISSATGWASRHSPSITIEGSGEAAPVCLRSTDGGGYREDRLHDTDQRRALEAVVDRGYVNGEEIKTRAGADMRRSRRARTLAFSYVARVDDLIGESGRSQLRYL
jgi:hypothetical protein